MFLTIKQPKNRQEFEQLSGFLSANSVKIADGAIRYSLSYCDYSGWDNRWTSLSISTNFRNETWAEKCTSSSGDKEIKDLNMAEATGVSTMAAAAS